MFYLEIETGEFLFLRYLFELLKKLRQTFAKTEFGTKFHQLLIGQATHGSVLCIAKQVVKINGVEEILNPLSE